MCTLNRIQTGSRNSVQFVSRCREVAWLAVLLAIVSISPAVKAAIPTLSANQSGPCVPAAAPVAAPKRAVTRPKVATKPKAAKTRTVGPQRRTKPQTKGHRAKRPVAVARAIPVRMQDGCGPSPVAARPTLDALMMGAAPVATYPQSTLPRFTVPLDATPAVVDNAPATGTPAPFDTVAPVIMGTAPGTGTDAWSPVFASPWVPVVISGGRPTRPATTDDGGWASPTQPPVLLPAPSDQPDVDPEVELPTAPDVEFNVDPSIPAIPDAPVSAEVPEPSSWALMVLGMLMACAQLRRQRSPVSRRR